MPHVIVLKDHTYYLTRYEGMGTKISIFKLNGKMVKIWKCNLGFLKIPLWIEKNLEIYTAPDQHFKIKMLNLLMSWENLCPNLNFTVENKMGNSHKRGWSHLQLNRSDWDIFQWIGKNIFHWAKWNELIKLIRECVRLKIKI